MSSGKLGVVDTPAAASTDDARRSEPPTAFESAAAIGDIRGRRTLRDLIHEHETATGQDTGWEPGRRHRVDHLISLNSEAHSMSVAASLARPDGPQSVQRLLRRLRNGSVAWTVTKTVYQVTSDKSWIDANVSDPLSLFSNNHVSTVEALARSMMSNATGLARAWE
jgi:hypothetical protein